MRRSDVFADQTPAEIAHAQIYPGVSIFAHFDCDSVVADEAVFALGNVVPFARGKRDSQKSPPIAVTPAERPTVAIAGYSSWKGGLLFIIGSILVHAAVVAAFNRPLPPKASLGVEIITVELELGAAEKAGVAPTPSDSENAENARAAEANTEPPAAEPAKPTPEPEMPPQPQAVIDESPEPAVKQAAQKPEPPHPQNIETKQKQKPPARKPEPRREKKATQSPVTSTPSVASSGVGRGSSETNANYRGMVAAHLQRYKGSVDQVGTAAVEFKLDGSGRVKSAGLSRSSGVEALDREVVAMARRASPFPAPPDGRPQVFRIPVNFKFR